jgi:hypothetical protein
MRLRGMRGRAGAAKHRVGWTTTGTSGHSHHRSARLLAGRSTGRSSLTTTRSQVQVLPPITARLTCTCWATAPPSPVVRPQPSDWLRNDVLMQAIGSLDVMPRLRGALAQSVPIRLTQGSCGMVRQVTDPARGVATARLHRAAVTSHSDFEPPARLPGRQWVPRVQGSFSGVSAASGAG